MKTSTNGINLIKSYEGLKLTAYKPVAEEPYYTIGYGHYGSDVKKGSVVTEQQAVDLLKKDLALYENYVNLLSLNLNQNQFDALVSFTYNCGATSLKKLVKNRTLAQIAEAILLYVKDVNGKTLKGLVKRRKAESELFLKKTGEIKLPYEVITTTALNIRNGAGTQYLIKKCVKKGTILKVWAIQSVNGSKWGKNEVGYFNLEFTKII